MCPDCDKCSHSLYECICDDDLDDLPASPTLKEAMTGSPDSIHEQLIEARENAAALHKRIKELELLSARRHDLLTSKDKLRERIRSALRKHYYLMYDNKLLSKAFLTDKPAQREINSLTDEFIKDFDDLLSKHHTDYYKTHFSSTSLSKT